MSHLKAKIAILAAAFAIVLITGTRLGSQTESTAPNSSGLEAGETTEAKIERAMSAGPLEIARSAKIIDKDVLGHMVVLRAGSNGFTCVPGNPNVIGDPPMCADEPSMQWAADFAEQTQTKQYRSRDHLHARGCYPAQRFRSV